MCKLIFINLLFLTFQNIKIYSFYRNIEVLAFIFFFRTISRNDKD